MIDSSWRNCGNLMKGVALNWGLKDEQPLINRGSNGMGGPGESEVYKAPESWVSLANVAGTWGWGLGNLGKV